VASTALGVGEISCTATDANQRLSMGFYGNSLHPGPARVIASIHGQDGIIVAESSRTVRIPAGYNQP
jgi:hypothetical protein